MSRGCGRVYFLRSEPEKAIPVLKRVLEIDSEDLTAHYNLMLCYRAAGDEEQSRLHENRYLRYKADEDAQAIARVYRQSHPHENNEAQPIHEHRSFYRTSYDVPRTSRCTSPTDQPWTLSNLRTMYYVRLYDH